MALSTGTDSRKTTIIIYLNINIVTAISSAAWVKWPNPMMCQLLLSARFSSVQRLVRVMATMSQDPNTKVTKIPWRQVKESNVKKLKWNRIRIHAKKFDFRRRLKVTVQSNVDRYSMKEFQTDRYSVTKCPLFKLGPRQTNYKQITSKFCIQE